MTTLAPVPDQAVVEHRRVTVVSWKATIGFGVVTALFALLLVLAPRTGNAAFRLATDGDLFTLPNLSVPGMATAWICVVVMALLVLLVGLLSARGRRVPLWVPVLFAVVFLFGFLAWAAAGSDRDIPFVRLIGGSVLLAVPIVFGALGGVIGERAGVVNIAIEGQLLAGAFTAAVVGSVTDSPWLGLLAAIVSGVLVAAVLAVFAITYRVNQVIVGVVLNVLVIGLTSFFYSQVLVPSAEQLNDTTRFERIAIPLLSKIPIIGPALFNQTVVVYLMYLAVPAVWFALSRTRWGLRVRAVGEHPKAADTVGIKVERTRWRAVLIAGGIAGVGGAFYTVVSVSSFGKEMTAGAGFIALAAVIFGNWDPIRAALAALLFGFASNLEGALSIVGAPVPSQFMLMLPYVVTILAVAGLVGRSRAPAASGEPYVKE
ncbi:ABC transporter permease [Cellulomonas fimi]|uniref:Inner-membrane translocator n=1 Tax=Cellulomonas fimi (strain ATCC 484 / DSM 20113 / JCM 1341 / CCUG 24087 / LMG 16345 / NBRC 15513 / NCIMB 8980 / NCTC 7547 / NRS-133) TaxID=590998 RepID=F4H823_CELFA|nr:ABC transporter permease [Cellulomonas fimi]AEE46984.1 inner-membrane translocator [Cellulomonas fimi ATCC 484]NNH07517.1 ABC transporter permease [Cellulomonas fimi]VEH34764.1 inner membrane ABC transporter permease protein YjfF [Cellulomonas fimi]